MSVLFYLLGLLAGAAAFFYFLSLYHSGSDHLAARRKAPRPAEKGVEIDAATLDLRDQVYPRERFCPICRAVLTKYEVLYASSVEIPGGTKIRIHGCRYCYRPDREEIAGDTPA